MWLLSSIEPRSRLLRRSRRMNNLKGGILGGFLEEATITHQAGHALLARSIFPTLFSPRTFSSHLPRDPRKKRPKTKTSTGPSPPSASTLDGPPPLRGDVVDFYELLGVRNLLLSFPGRNRENFFLLLLLPRPLLTLSREKINPNNLLRSTTTPPPRPSRPPTATSPRPATRTSTPTATPSAFF